MAATGLSGCILVAMGMFGMGAIVKYVPRPVVAGFTAGIATYIFSTQIKDFLGLGAPGRLPEGVTIPSEFLEKVRAARWCVWCGVAGEGGHAYVACLLLSYLLEGLV